MGAKCAGPSTGCCAEQSSSHSTIDVVDSTNGVEQFEFVKSYSVGLREDSDPIVENVVYDNEKAKALARWYALPLVASRTWKDEWPALRAEEIRLRGQERSFRRGDFDPGGKAHIDVVLEHFSVFVSWQLRNGWDKAQAEAYTVLASCGRAALARALREGSPCYAASQHIVFSALRDRALLLSQAAPDCYRNLTGSFSLSAEDPGWALLYHPDARAGLCFRTSSVTTAYEGRSYFPNDRGFCMSVSKAGKVLREMQDSDVVRFCSSASEGCMLRSLVETAEGTYDLPPLGMVALESVLEPGEWDAYGIQVKRRLFTVRVSFSLHHESNDDL
eukprot:gnl/TRDRNA2_/TRDRNA2_91094_c0_seq1.p1 gnl/TRDRNA2_/TRDRNA2_91094_c0~~gnl/TRDRNA2_/TRDRNA2_91094_c0_seq1.p1  ORF type:complete len:331 (+),score=55.08 gnl/TRDRNA2_/TRDRNA2_91094_c0_seq1:62-1054(+)